MALQLIDLGNEVEVVEIDTSKVPYTFSVKLTDKTYTFTVKYNEAGSFFTVDLATSDGEPLVYGDIVRYGRPRLPEYAVRSRCGIHQRVRLRYVHG